MEAKALVTYEEKALAEFEITPAEVAEKAKEFLAMKVIPDDAKSYKVAKAALSACVSYRTSTDKRRKELGEDARKWVNAVNATQKALIAPLAPAEEYLRNELNIEDGRRAEVKAEKARIEKERVDRIRDQIEGMRLVVFDTQGKTSAEISDIISEIQKIQITEDSFMEFTQEAERIKDETLDNLLKAYRGRLEWEKQEKARKEEEAKLAEDRKKQEEERKAIAEEQRKIREEKERLERTEFERKALDEAKEKAEKDAKEKAERKERERKEREEREAREKTEKEEAERKEKERQEQLKPDKEKLKDFYAMLLRIQPPELKQEEAKNLAANAMSGIRRIAKSLLDDLEEL